MIILFALLISFLLSILSTYFIKEFAIRRNLLDKPAAIKIHSSPTPRLGGIGMAFGWLAGVVFLYLNGELDSQFFVFFACASSSFLLFGVVDDFWPLKPGLKILALTLLTLGAVWLFPNAGWYSTMVGKSFPSFGFSV